MKVIFSGLESSGKSLLLAKTVRELIYRNAEWLKVTGVMRPIRSNIRFAPHVVERAKELGIEIYYWKDLEDLTPHTEFDLVIDEIGTYFDSRKWSDLSLDVRRWIVQGAKCGIEMYGTAQDFAQVDKAFRRLTTNLVHITKIMGSRRPSATTPPIKRIWGICAKTELDPLAYKEDKDKFEGKGLPSFFFIVKEDCIMYDTQQKIAEAKLPPFKHQVRECLHEGCGHVKVSHV